MSQLTRALFNEFPPFLDMFDDIFDSPPVLVDANLRIPTVGKPLDRHSISPRIMTRTLSKLKYRV